MKKTDLKPVKKIESPLAKYNSTGQLFCVLCNQPVKNEQVWTAHVNGRVHRDNLNQLKGKKRPLDSRTTDEIHVAQKKLAIEPGPSASSRTEFKAPLPVTLEFKVPPVPSPKPWKENVSTVPIPRNVSHGPNPQSLSLSTLRVSVSQDDKNGMDIEEQESTTGTEPSPTSVLLPDSDTTVTMSNGEGSTVLPEGFFDDPKLDAKIRGLEYRNPEEIEWENFVKEIASEEAKSSTIRTEDEEESTVNRDLDEIEEQMTHWQRVLDLEQKAKILKGMKPLQKNVTVEEDMEDEDFDEELDWRSKRH